MELESVGIAAALALALFPLMRVAIGSTSRAGLASLLLFGLAIPVVTFASRHYSSPSAIDPSVIDRPVVEPNDSYVTSSACRSCHPSQYASWDASYHRKMTQEGVPGAVLGDFDGVTLEAGGWLFHLERRGDEFWTIVESNGDGTENGPSRVEKPVVMTTGSHHYQVYWLPDEQKGVLRAFPFVYLTDEKKWIPRNAAFLSPPTGPITEEKARWNNGCAKCHSLNARWRPLRPKTDTHVAELGISCEACHGPAEQHVRAHSNPAHRYSQHWSDDSDETVVQPGRLDSRRASEICGQCHSISRFTSRDEFTDWAHNGYRYRPGDVLGDSRSVVRGLLDENSSEMRAHVVDLPQFLKDSFWPDGTVRITGREYNALLDTPCFQRGELSCLSCHTLHSSEDDPRPLSEWANDQLKPGMRGNRACIQCHEDFASEQRLTSHTQHRPDSSGSECQNCHMPYATYGLLKAIRSHTIENPSVVTSLETGRPNACNQCHLDKTFAWAAEHLSDRYGTPVPALSEDEQTIAASLLWLLRGHAGQRALAAWTMGWGPAREISGSDWIAPYLAQLLVDPYDAVRFVASRSLREQTGFSAFSYDALSDPAERSRTSARALGLWSRIERHEDLDGSREILFDAEGKLELDTIRRLVQARDDHPVVFRE